MVDFTQLLKRPAGQAPKPKALPIGNYPGVISKFELLPAPAGKDYQMIVRIHLGLTGWPDGISEDETLQPMGDGTSKPIDLSKKQLRRDYYDNSMYRLDELIKSCHIEPNGQSYEEILPQLIGAAVVVDVQQYMNQNTNEVGNQVGKLTGA